MKIKSLTLYLLVLIGLQSFAQSNKKRCGFDRIYQNLQKDSSYLANLKAFQKQPAILKENSNSIITIPVVVHVIYKNASENISDKQIHSQIAVLNEDFRKLNSDTTNVEKGFSKSDSKIEFCLAKYDPNGNPTDGIERYKTKTNEIGNTEKYYQEAPIWDRDSYLNIWVCNMGTVNAGFAYSPGAPANKDGLVIHYQNFGRQGNLQAPYNKGRTTSHEVGHWLDLLHPWGMRENCDANDDDKVKDTPQQKKPYFDCPNPPKSSCGSKDMLSNFMGYVDDACMGNFTAGQKQRMRLAIFNKRASLLQSNACGTTGIAKNSNLESGLIIYPNPSKNNVFISVEKNLLIENIELEVFQMNGKKVYPYIQKTNKGYQLNFQMLSTGTYLISINNGADQLLKKVILIP